MEEFLQNIGVGIRSIDDPFFEESHRNCKIFKKQGVIIEDDEELCHEVMREFPCYFYNCNATFQTLLDFEMHYNSCHRYVCAICKKSLPNPRLLDIHIQEKHDSYFKVAATKRAMYQCYMSECDLKFNDPIERRTHCITVHKFYRTFQFENAQHYKKDDFQDKMEIDCVDNTFSKMKQKMLELNKNQRTKMFTAASKTTMPGCLNPGAIQSNSSNRNVSGSSLSFIPKQVQKSYTKALTNNQSKERNVLETQNMMDLADSLPE